MSIPSGSMRNNDCTRLRVCDGGVAWSAAARVSCSRTACCSTQRRHGDTIMAPSTTPMASWPCASRSSCWICPLRMAMPLTGETDERWQVQLSGDGGHRYRMSAYADEGHGVDVELVADADAKPVDRERGGCRRTIVDATRVGCDRSVAVSVDGAHLDFTPASARALTLPRACPYIPPRQRCPP